MPVPKENEGVPPFNIDEIVQNLKNDDAKELHNTKRRLYYSANKEKWQEYHRLKSKEHYQNNKENKKAYYESKKNDPEFIEKRKQKYQETKRLISLGKKHSI